MMGKYFGQGGWGDLCEGVTADPADKVIYIDI